MLEVELTKEKFEEAGLSFGVTSLGFCCDLAGAGVTGTGAGILGKLLMSFGSGVTAK